MDIEVTVSVKIALKEEAFSSAFLAVYRENFSPFMTIEDHAKYLAQLLARGMIEPVGASWGRDQFVEGYGPIGEFVTSAALTSFETDIVTGVVV